MESNLLKETDVRPEYVRGLEKELHDVEQILGKALGFPYYSDDQKNFPGATPEEGVCVGEHTAATLAATVADKLKELNQYAKYETDTLRRVLGRR